MPSFVFAVLFIPSYHVLNSLFKCLTPSADGFHCLKKIRDTAPLNPFRKAKVEYDPFAGNDVNMFLPESI